MWRLMIYRGPFHGPGANRLQRRLRWSSGLLCPEFGSKIAYNADWHSYSNRRQGVDNRPDQILGQLLSDGELAKLLDADDLNLLKAILVCAIEFDGAVAWAEFDSRGKSDYHAATIRSRMDSFFEFKYLCNVLVPETKTACYPMPASLSDLRQLHQDGVADLEDSKVPSEDRLTLLKRLMALELHYFAYAY
jgi:hypothetical protein